jgi:protein TonB
MFRESLIETSVLMRARRRWATLASFFLETAAIGLLVLFPLIYTDALPRLHFGEPMPPPPGRRPTVPKGRVTTLVQVPDDIRPTVLESPRFIPSGVDMRPDTKRAASASDVTGDQGPCDGCVPWGVPDGDPNSRNPVLTALLKPTPIHADLKPPKPAVIRLSRMEPGMLIARVEPKYPPLAVQTRTQGEVVLTAVIGRDGRIENLHVVSGHPFLIASAVDAVRQWRYRPYILNGQPVEVETQITVNFRLGR